MSQQIRLDSDLISQASMEASLNKRSVPKQIEYWAELGRMVSKVLNIYDVLGLLQGTKKLKVEDMETDLPSLKELLEVIDSDPDPREGIPEFKNLSVIYEANEKNNKSLDQINIATGERQTGNFRNGKFIPVRVA